MGIIAFYITVLIFTNYQTFAHSGMPALAVQGRYMFGFLPVIYLLANFYIFKLLKFRVLSFAYIVVTLVIFLSAGLPSYLVLTNKDWYTAHTADINLKLHNDLWKLRQQ